MTTDILSVKFILPQWKLLNSVTVALPPEDYAERVVPLFSNCWVHLRLCARSWPTISPYPKLERYYKELRPNLPANEDRCDLTLEFLVRVLACVSDIV